VRDLKVGQSLRPGADLPSRSNPTWRFEMSLTQMFPRPVSRRRALPQRVDLIGPALRAVAALGGTATAEAVFRAAAAELRLGRSAEIKGSRNDRRSLVHHETAFALTMLGKADLLRTTPGGWTLTDDGKRLAEQMSDPELVEVVRAARRRKRAHEPVRPILGLREIQIPLRDSIDPNDPTPCTYVFAPLLPGPVKIGFTSIARLYERLAETDSGPTALRVTALFDGGRSTETLLHRRFAYLRVRPDREWFYVDEELALLAHAALSRKPDVAA
jgi:hypothetical protein